jgi:hypothetical protein
MMSVAIKADASFEAGTPTPLFTSPVPIANYDAMPDGMRFLILNASGVRGSNPVSIVLNWTVGLRK